MRLVQTSSTTCGVLQLLDTEPIGNWGTALGSFDPGADKDRRQPFLRRGQSRLCLIKREAWSRASVQQRRESKLSRLQGQA